MKKTARILAAALVLGTTAPAMAEGFYGAVDVGNTHAADVCLGQNAMGCKGGATALRIGGGYQFQQNWAGELSYAKYGSGSLGFTPRGVARGDWSASGLQISLVGSLPINNEAALLAKVGYGINNFSAGALSASNNTVTGGFGFRYNVDKQLSVRAMYENLGTFGDPFTTGLTRMSLFTVGGMMKF